MRAAHMKCFKLMVAQQRVMYVFDMYTKNKKREKKRNQLELTQFRQNVCFHSLVSRRLFCLTFTFLSLFVALSSSSSTLLLLLLLSSLLSYTMLIYGFTAVMVCVSLFSTRIVLFLHWSPMYIYNIMKYIRIEEVQNGFAGARGRARTQAKARTVINIVYRLNTEMWCNACEWQQNCPFKRNRKRNGAAATQESQAQEEEEESSSGKKIMIIKTNETNSSPSTLPVRPSTTTTKKPGKRSKTYVELFFHFFSFRSIIIYNSMVCARGKQTRVLPLLLLLLAAECRYDMIW